MNLKISIIAFFALLLIFSCEETAEPSGPCDDNRWVTATRNGEEYCLGVAEVGYFNANTSSAKIIMSARDESAVTTEIYAEFSIPVEGVALNTPYSILTGNIHEADAITEGTLTFLVFDPPSVGKAGCFAGTFSLKATSGGFTTFQYENGRFVYFKGAGTESSSDAGCNPF